VKNILYLNAILMKVMCELSAIIFTQTHFLTSVLLGTYFSLGETRLREVQRSAHVYGFNKDEHFLEVHLYIPSFMLQETGPTP
jgi:hypothetical protein